MFIDMNLNTSLSGSPVLPRHFISGNFDIYISMCTIQNIECWRVIIHSSAAFSFHDNIEYAFYFISIFTILKLKFIMTTKNFTCRKYNSAPKSSAMFRKSSSCRKGRDVMGLSIQKPRPCFLLSPWNKLGVEEEEK